MKNRLVWVLGFLLIVLIVVQLIRGYWQDKEKNLRINLRESAQQQFPVAFEITKASYGIQPYSGSLFRNEDAGNGKNVILVHGLDDPGIIWRNLAPALAESGYRVWIMSYPNDQPIRDSAVFFGKQMELFATEHGVNPVAVICHSMGGLVAREMLTNPDIGYETGSNAGSVPALTHLIMVGTPNHGSIFSRFRLFSEIRDQLVSAGNDEYHWLRSVFDGMGEAGIDLYPGSDFLQKLNDRPPPDVDNILIIAGLMSPLDQQDIEKSIEEIIRSFPESVRAAFIQMQPLMEQMIYDIGDGLVSLDSARMAGIPLRQVQGSHVSIIRNLIKNSDRIPPAIPVILQELDGSRS
ncbi:MAG: alpha/beta fold hydrolase [Desulforhopalus sp.]